MLLFPFVSPSLAWLYFSSAGSLGCVRHCNQTRFVIANWTDEIVLPGCKQCTSCSLKNQEIVQAWWHYCYHNGTCIPYQNGHASGFRNYSINVRLFVLLMAILICVQRFVNSFSGKMNMHLIYNCVLTIIKSLLLLSQSLFQGVLYIQQCVFFLYCIIVDFSIACMSLWFR